MTTNVDQTIEALQARVAFMDDELTALRDSVDAHQRQILALEQHCRLLTERLAGVLESVGDGGATTDERPPHY